MFNYSFNCVPSNRPFNSTPGIKYFKFTLENKIKNDLYLFRCECGNKVEMTIPQLYSGRRKSCGCWIKEIRKKWIKILNDNANNPKFNIIEAMDKFRKDNHYFTYTFNSNPDKDFTTTY